MYLKVEIQVSWWVCSTKNKGEIIINLKNLNKIRNINLTDNSVIIESGCILENLKKKLNESDMEFPLNMGSKEVVKLEGYGNRRS